MLLEMEDALVSSYLDPRQALQEAAEKRFDVILTDIGMPEMDGHEFVSALREKKQHRLTPTIALSGYGTNQAKRADEATLFDRRLTKPVQYDELVEAIEAVCRIGQA